MTGPGELVQDGAGDVTLTGSNMIAGPTAVESGTLTLDSTNFSSMSVAISPGATLQVGNNDAAGTLGSAEVTDDGTLTFAPSGTVNVSNDIGGSGQLIQDGAAPSRSAARAHIPERRAWRPGLWPSPPTEPSAEQAGSRSTRASLDVQANLAASIPIDASGAGATGEGALLTSVGMGTIGGNVTLSSDVSVGGAGTLDLAGDLVSSSYGLTQVGSGTVILGADNSGSFSGTTTIEDGVLSIGHDYNLGMVRPVRHVPLARD